jgi:hypothetical protein
MACAACDALIGQPATVHPHDALYGERARVRSDGMLAQFRCRICGTLLERFEGNRYYKKEPKFWTLLLPPVLTTHFNLTSPDS